MERRNLNFIGEEELKKIKGLNSSFNVLIPKKIPDPTISLKNIKKNELLIFGPSKLANGRDLTINEMRLIFGTNPDNYQPCFYNQDWYLKEDFTGKKTLEDKWYLIEKTLRGNSRGQNPDNILLNNNEKFPSAVLTAFVFFVYWFLNNGEILWKNDFVWCSDKDSNGDKIYVGRYIDEKKINKNGFNIHRHLSIRPCYGASIQKL